MTSPEQKKYLRKRKINKLLVITVQLFILIFFIFLWQFLADKSLINTFITSSPQKVLETIIELYQAGNLFNHIYITIYETIVSFLIGTILGIIIAILMYNSPFFSKVIDPYLTILNSLPKVALGPIIIIWAGAGMKSIIIMALLISLIITIVTVYGGFQSTDQTKIRLLKSLKASKYQILKLLVLPNSYPTIISSLKINISMSLIGIKDMVRENSFKKNYNIL